MFFDHTNNSLIERTPEIDLKEKKIINKKGERRINIKENSQ